MVVKFFLNKPSMVDRVVFLGQVACISAIRHVVDAAEHLSRNRISQNGTPEIRVAVSGI